MSTALLFSGQGSQYVGMMKDLAGKYERAKSMIAEADEILGYSLSSICFDGPMDVLKETRYTQPALFLHSAVVFDLIKEKLPCDAVAGHSVGEYAALYASGALRFSDALRLVSLRGKLMFAAGEKDPGTMFAVIGLDDAKAEEICESLTAEGKGNVVVPANYNSPGQIVVSGSADYLRENVGRFKAAGAKIVKELVVSGAFHSPLMQAAKLELEEAINSIEFRHASVPVYSNVTAKPVMRSDELKSKLIMQLTSPVKWSQSLRHMQEAGIGRYVEIGAGNVLQGLVKRTLQGVEILGFDKSEEVEKIL